VGEKVVLEGELVAELAEVQAVEEVLEAVHHHPYQTLTLTSTFTVMCLRI
jgi:hypothetical protein